VTVTPRAGEEEDFLEDLPPIDGALGEEESPAGDEAGGADELSGLDDDGGLDDATLGGDPTAELVVEGAEAGWLVDSNEDDALEVGSAATTFAEGERLLDDLEEGEAEEDYDLAGADSAAGLDRGEEGPEGEGDDLSESELPRLDADDEGDADALVLDAVELGDEVQHPWDDRAWRRVGVPLGVAPMCAVALGLADGVALAGGRVLASMEPGGRCALLGADGLAGALVKALAVVPGGLMAVATDAGILVSTDGGATFSPRGGWRAIVPAGDARRVLALGCSGGALAALTPAGRVIRARDAHDAEATAWDEPLPGKRFVGLTQDAGRVAALVSGPVGAVALARLDAGPPEVTPLPSMVPPLRVDVGGPLAVRGANVAFAVESVAVFRSIAGGPWERVPGTGDATAMTFIDDAGTLLVALRDPSEERAFVIRAPRDDAPRIVAEVGEEERDATTAAAADAPADHEAGARGAAHVAALVWDDAARVVWGAGAFGIAAFRPT